MNGPVREPYGERQFQVDVDTITKLVIKSMSERGYPPTVREIGETVGLDSTASTFALLRRMQRRGYIEVDENTPRGIRLTGYIVDMKAITEEL